MKKMEVFLTVWILLCAVPPATQIDWTVSIFAFATLLGFAGLYFGLAIGRVAKR